MDFFPRQSPWESSWYYLRHGSWKQTSPKDRKDISEERRSASKQHAASRGILFLRHTFLDIDPIAAVLYWPCLIFFFFYVFHRLDNIPSANLRQQKLEQQRLKIEQKQKQKREQGNKTIHASDLKSASSVKRGGRPLSGRKELHGYDGPLQFLHGGNPDDMTTVQVPSAVLFLLYISLCS